MSKVSELLLEAVRSGEKEYTSGSINRAIVLLSIPMILEMVMESLFAVVDVYFVSKVGVDAVATVGLTESVLTLIYSVAIGMSTAATAMVARRVGENRPEEAAVAAAQSIFLAIGLAVLIGVPGVVFADDILRFMGGSEQLIAAGTNYTRIALGSNVVIMLLFLLNGVFRGAGDAAIAMRVLWIANGINIVLGPLLIFGIGPFPEMGLTGAAVATACGRGIGVLLQLYYLVKGVGVVKLERRHLVAVWDVIVRLVRVGSTGALQFLIMSASWIFLIRIIAQFGSDAVAGYTVAIRVIMFTTLPSWGLSNAAATLVGQNLGAGKPDRAETSVWRASFYNMLFLLSLSIALFIGAEPIIRIFNDTPAVVEAGVLSLRILSAGYIFWAYGMVVIQSFNGAGDTLTPTLINLLCFWALEIPLGYFLAITLGWGIAGVAAAVTFSESIWAVIAVIIFRMGRWKQVKI
jgi:putative MATE family efflux protein